MGCAMRIIVVGGSSDTVGRVVERVTELERRWSRFLPHSELSLLNAAGGRETVVSVDTLRLLTTMIDGHRATDGAFDPTLVVPLVTIGYGSSLGDPSLRTDLPLDLHHRGRITDVGVDPDAKTVRLPIGTALDAGGVGKGLAADIVAEEFVDHECDGLLVSIGGDVVVAGRAPEDCGWAIDILDPAARHHVDCVHIDRGAVATSSTELRVFAGGHHLIDPTTLRSATSGVRGASVIAGSGAWAEMLTKPLMITGRSHLPRLDALGIGASITDIHGRAHNDAWAQLAVKR